MKICLDAGHSLVTAGKRIPADIAKIVGNMHEWEFNSSVAHKVSDLLSKYQNVETFRSDDITGNTDIDVNTRVRNINKQNPALVISIHANAGRGTGVETFVWNKTCTGSLKVANVIQPNLINYTGMRNRGVKYGNFALVRDTRMNAILIESGFMDTVSDARQLLSDEYRNKIALAIVDGLVVLYGLKKKTVVVPIKPSPVVPKGYTGSSIVDYLKSIGVNSSAINRYILARKYGVRGYDKSAGKNTELLKAMRGW